MPELTPPGADNNLPSSRKVGKMKHQISASLVLDVASLADAIAERLQQPAPGLTAVTPHEALIRLAEALSNTLGLHDRQAAADMLTMLRAAGYVLAALPTAPATPTDWFSRGND
jgi:hypothetical protein